MVELRKRPAPPAVPPPAKKKAAPKVTSKKEDPPAVEVSAPALEAPAALKGGVPKRGDTINLEGFGGEVETHDERKVTLAQLVADSKTGVVLFTYPKASTPGCTNQVCLFRDSYEELTATGLGIYGLSNDSPKSNTSFRTKQKLPYTLLCDRDLKLISAIGMKKSPSGTTRGVFAVDKAGKVLAAEPGGPAATVDVVKAIVMDVGGGGDATAAVEDAENKLAADTAAEVANAAKVAGIDKSKTSTPVPA